MNRRYWILAALALGGCAQPPPAPGILLPPTLAGVWQRKSLRSIPPPQSGVLRAFEAAYEGAGRLTVDLDETNALGTAFEMAQHRRAAANAVFFDKGRFFVVVKWEQADRQALKALVREMQNELARVK